MKTIRKLYVDSTNDIGDPAKRPMKISLHRCANPAYGYCWFHPGFDSHGEPTDAYRLYSMDLDVAGCTVAEAIRRAYAAWGKPPYNLRKNP